MKKIIWIVVVISSIFIIVYKVPYSRRIYKEMKAVQFRIGDSEYEEVVTITIKGTYKNHLFKDDIYDGIIQIDKYDLTYEYPLLMPIRLANGKGLLIYGGAIKGKPVHETLGLIICTPGFDELFISVLESDVHESEGDKKKGWNALDGLCISGPAENKLQALDIIRELSSENNMLSDIDWN